MTQVVQQNTQESAASLFWNDLMAKHPTLAGILAIVLEVVGFFLNGHFLVFTGRWVIRVNGYVAETALLFAVLWISATSIAPSLVELFMSKEFMAHLVMVALITLALIPEIILANAIINAIKHWMDVVRDRHNIMAWVWAFLFTVPTIMFLVLTAITLNSLGSNGGNFVQASTDTLNFRMDAGWIYGLLEVVYAGVRRMAPQLIGSSQQNDVQTINDLRVQITEAQSLLTIVQQEKRQYEDEQTEIVQRLRDQIAVLKETHEIAVAGSENQLQVLTNLQNRLQVAEQETATLTAKWEQKCREAETANTDLQSAKLQITDLQNAVSQPASADLQPAKVQSAPSARPQTAKLQNADHETAKLPSAKIGSQSAYSAKSTTSQTANAVAPNITSLEQERAKRPQKIAHAEVLDYMAAHSAMRRADVAVALGISERKVYDALAWQKEQEGFTATGTN